MANPTYMGTFVGGNYPGSGTARYANSAVSASGAGTSWSTAYKTIAEAVTGATAGDPIFISGSFNEAVSCAKAGIRFIGAGTGPEHVTWTAPTVNGGSTACLTLTAANCEIANMTIRPVIYLASGAPSGIALGAGATGTFIHHNIFKGLAGSLIAIELKVGQSGVVIQDNRFFYMNTLTTGAAIKGAFTASRWVIERNIFDSCVTAIEIEGRTCIIRDNVLVETGLAANNAFGGAIMTKGVDLTGTDTGGNKVCNNDLGGAYSNALYLKGGTGDEWEGNRTRSTTATITNGAGLTLTATA